MNSVIKIGDGDLGLMLAAEEFSDEQFSLYHFFSKTDEQVIRRLLVPGPVLLRGPRGSGKSAYMLAAHKRVKESVDPVISFYVSLRHFPLLAAAAEEYLGVLIPYVIQTMRTELTSRGIHAPPGFESVRSVSEFKEILSGLGTSLSKRIVLLFDDVAHIGRETSLEGFFDFFRTISSSMVSCKASIYPGVTKFGSRFDFYSDATIVEAQRDERSADFAEFFKEVMKVRYSHLLTITDIKLQPLLSLLLGRGVLGNVRAFIALCGHLEGKTAITIHSVGDALKWLASNYLYPALEELRTKLGAYVPMLDVVEDLAPIFFDDCGKKRVTSMLVHKDHVQRLSKVFEILEYTGFLAKREASRSLSQSGSGRGPRYALSLGPLFEKIPGGTLSYDLIASFTRVSIANEELVEYPPDSLIRQFDCPQPNNEVSLDILSLPVSKLEKSTALPYGLTKLMIDSLVGSGHETIQDVVKLTLKDLMELPGIAGQKAKKIRNAVEQAVWM